MTVDFDSSGMDLNEDDLLSAEFDQKFGRPTLEKEFSYKVVGRLSRWEGGGVSPYSANDLANESEEREEVEKMSFKELFWQLFRPSYDLTEVTIEDVERVKMMHDRFLGDCSMNFNYTTLLTIASVIAAVGLGMNSTASIIASMLISPLMGPVTAISYGIAIKDLKMARMAIVCEVASLMLCILIGVVVASIFLLTPAADDWPVPEMTSRGTMENFYAGIPIAFFSGLGVAVGLLDSQTNSLVGVAISASLLPPAVNCGMLLVIHIRDEYDSPTETWREYGVISLLLTVMNIAVIIFAALIMFRLKEILPIEKSIFWSDLGVARKIYSNVAIIPTLQAGPTDQEIKSRVMRFFPRCSEMARVRPSVLKNTRNLNIAMSDDGDETERDLNSSTTGMLARISE